MTSRLVGVLLLGTFAIGCGGNGSNNNGGDDEPPVDSPGGTPDVQVPDGYTKLIGRTWTLQAGQLDIYRCVRVTIPTDMYITSIMSQAPLGTHHTVLSIADGFGGAGGPDGEQDCNVNTLGLHMLYASGVGTSPLDFPENVGIKIAAGTQIHLNLHLYNASDGTLTGDSAILVKSQPTPPPILAEMIFAGSLNFTVPSMTPPQESTVTGGCTVNQGYTLFAVWPHMHKLARHQKIELRRGASTTVLHDRAYDFTEQTYYLQQPPVQVLAGDRIRVTCTYLNDVGHDVGFGDSSDEEMCFGGLYRYPATGSILFGCVGGG